MRFVSKILPLLMAALAVPGQAAELSAAQVAAVLGVPITKAKTEPNRASAKSIDTSYETAGGDAVVIVPGVERSRTCTNGSDSSAT